MLRVTSQIFLIKLILIVSLAVLLAIPFPSIDPVLISVGPIAVRWYALAYILGLVLGWRLLRRKAASSSNNFKEDHADDILVWLIVGVIVGGRLGYVIFYNFSYFLANPLKILATWEGGMSFHGGLLGVVIISLIFCRRHKLEPLALGDMLACVAPIGLFFGRVANFINGELYGRETDLAWGVIFPRGGPNPRHPSQIYEAFLEGIVLFIIINIMWKSQSIRECRGVLTGTFLAGYAIARMLAEIFRQPDAHIGFLALGGTIGQWLSLPMLLVGLGFIIQGIRRQ